MHPDARYKICKFRKNFSRDTPLLGVYIVKFSKLGALPLDPFVLLPIGCSSKPTCIEPAAGNRLTACVDHAHPAPVCRPFKASPSATRFRHRHLHIPELTSGFNCIDFSKIFSFVGPIPLSLHRWG